MKVPHIAINVFGRIDNDLCNELTVKPVLRTCGSQEPPLP